MKPLHDTGNLRRRSILRTVFGLTALFVALECGTRAAADFLAIGPRAQLQDAAEEALLPIDRDWGPAYRVLHTAADIKPGDASMQFELGRMSWLQAMHPDNLPATRAELLARAETHLEKVVAARPAWGRAWAELANVRYQHGRYMDARAALRVAMDLVPYEFASQQPNITTGFALWPVLDAADRKRLMRIAAHVARYKSRGWLIDATVPYRREALIRAFVVPGSPDMRYLERRIRERRAAARRG